MEYKLVSSWLNNSLDYTKVLSWKGSNNRSTRNEINMNKKLIDFTILQLIF